MTDDIDNDRFSSFRHRFDLSGVRPNKSKHDNVIDLAKTRATLHQKKEGDPGWSLAEEIDELFVYHHEPVMDQRFRSMIEELPEDLLVLIDSALMLAISRGISEQHEISSQMIEEAHGKIYEEIDRLEYKHHANMGGVIDEE